MTPRPLLPPRVNCRKMSRPAILGLMNGGLRTGRRKPVNVNGVT